MKHFAPSHLKTTPRGNVCTPDSAWISDGGFMARKDALPPKVVEHWQKRPCSNQSVTDELCDKEIDSWRCNSTVVDEWETRPALDVERLKHDRAIVFGWQFNAKAASALKSISAVVGLQVHASGHRARLLFLDANTKPVALLMNENSKRTQGGK